MSIVTLKRKTQTQYNNMSVGSKTGFSLNGTLRNQSYIGQSNQSRYLTRTLSRGGATRGHGGCCGKFINYPNIIGLSCLNDPNVVKKSSLNTQGMIDTKYMWVKRPYPYSSFKPDSNSNSVNNDQGSYIERLAKKEIQRAISDSENCVYPEPIVCPKKPPNTDFHLNPKKNACVITKDPSTYTSIDQGSYLRRLMNKCTENDVVYVPKTTCEQPFGFTLG